MNAYDKLRPYTIEACECNSVSGLFLIDLFTNNPLHCEVCRKEVDPERLKLSTQETEAVAGWYAVASSLYRLWLDSGEYEDYAKSCLVDPNGQVTRDGLKLAEALSDILPTKLWLFSDSDDGTPTHCPICGSELDTNVRWGTGACSKCRVQM